MRGKPAISIPDEAKKRAIASIKQYFVEIMEEEIGDLKASLLLDFILKEIGPTVYNQAIGDAGAFFEQQAADIDGVCYKVEFPYWTKPGRVG